MPGNNGLMMRWLKNLGRVPYSLACLAMLGALWASVDLHQHQSGLHKPVECAACSIEKSISHGFAPQTDIQALPQTAANEPSVWHKRQEYSACLRIASIRAPPFA